MIKLSSTYKGFALGFRIADTVALQYTPGNAVHIDMLHSLKNLVNQNNLINEIGACGINGKLYITTQTK